MFSSLFSTYGVVPPLQENVDLKKKYNVVLRAGQTLPVACFGIHCCPIERKGGGATVFHQSLSLPISFALVLVAVSHLLLA